MLSIIDHRIRTKTLYYDVRFICQLSKVIVFTEQYSSLIYLVMDCGDSHLQYHSKLVPLLRLWFCLRWEILFDDKSILHVYAGVILNPKPNLVATNQGNSSHRHHSDQEREKQSHSPITINLTVPSQKQDGPCNSSESGKKHLPLTIITTVVSGSWLMLSCDWSYVHVILW